ncbi:hypothetical protein UlMin_003445, partial [Ulmus minor]
SLIISRKLAIIPILELLQVLEGCEPKDFEYGGIKGSGDQPQRQLKSSASCFSISSYSFSFIILKFSSSLLFFVYFYVLFYFAVQERNEKLFYKLLIDSVEELFQSCTLQQLVRLANSTEAFFWRLQGLYIGLNR